jgi:hypothetical protein
MEQQREAPAAMIIRCRRRRYRCYQAARGDAAAPPIWTAINILALINSGGHSWWICAEAATCHNGNFSKTATSLVLAEVNGARSKPGRRVGSR